MRAKARIQPETRTTRAIAWKLAGEGAPSDAKIAGGVRRALAEFPLTPGERMQFSVTNGWVTLTGEVEQRRRREEAVRAVEHLPGVAGVSDLILLTAQAPSIEPGVVHQAIDEALHRHAEREAARIAVRVEQGILTLTGDVYSWPERQAILDAAGHAPGVREVADHLRFRPYP